MARTSRDEPVDVEPTEDQRTKRDALLARAGTAAAANRAFLAIKNPSGAEVTAQVRALTVQVAALSRLVVGDWDAPLEQ